MFFSVVKQGNILGETSSIRTNFVKHCLRKEAGKKKTAQNGTLGTNDIITFLERINTSEVQWWVFIRLNGASSYTNKSPSKVIIFGYYSLRTWLYFCIVFMCGIATSAHYDVTIRIRTQLLFFRPWFHFGAFEVKYLWEYLSVRRMAHVIQIISARQKNGDYVICTLKENSKIWYFYRLVDKSL